MGKPYDLEERTLLFAKDVVRLCKKTPRDSVNSRIVGQLVGAAGSVGANYREANEKLGKKDFAYRLRISRKECKEATYWLEILKEANDCFIGEANSLIVESKELRNILTSILAKAES